MKEKFESLMRLLEQGKELKEVNLEEILKEAVQFFDDLRLSYPKASKEEKAEMLHMMRELHLKLQDISKQVAAKVGMTEEQLFVYSENPSNFPPEQWQLIRDTKQKLYESARKFSSSVEAKETGPEAHTKRPLPPKGKRPKKSDWKKT